jgi:uncharacterized protein YecE (DUF72 family)
VYSAPEGINYLSEYSRTYHTVEIDQWFWSLFGTDSHGEPKISLPDMDTVAEYLGSVPDDFRFSIKMPNSLSLTHHYLKKRGEVPLANRLFLSPDLLGQFLERIEPMQSRVLSLMFEFEYLNRQKMQSLHAFLSALDGFAAHLPAGWPFAVEIRNPNFLTDDFFSFLGAHRIAPVLCDGYYMPPAVEVYEKYGHLFDSRVVVRLLGTDRQGIERQTGKRWNAIVAPKDKEIVAIANMVRDMVNRGLTVIVNVNNHYEGSAPITIGKLIQELGPELLPST